LLKNLANFRSWRKAQSSIRIQEGEPNLKSHFDFARFFTGIVKPSARFASFCSGFAYLPQAGVARNGCDLVLGAPGLSETTGSGLR